MSDDREDNYFVPPHGGRPPSDEAIRKATRRYVEEERAARAREKQADKEMK